MPARPGLYAVDVATGKYDWQAPSADICKGKPLCHPGYSGAVTATSQLVVAGANDGYIRIYDAGTGKLVWERDTVQPFKTVNGVMAHGGSMGGGAAPVLDRGMLFMPSGYGFAGKMPGDVLLAFGVN